MNALSKGERNFIYTPAKYRLDFNIFKNASDKSPSLRVFESDSEDGFNREIETLFNMYFKEHKENRAIKTPDGVQRFLNRGDGPRFNFYNDGLFHGLVLDVGNYCVYPNQRISLEYVEQLLKDLTYVIYTSLDHMTHGVERFHVVIPFRKGVRYIKYKEIRHHLLSRDKSLSLNTRNDVANLNQTWLLPQHPVFASKGQPTFSRNYGILISDELPIPEKIIPRNQSTVFQVNSSIPSEKVKQNFKEESELIFNLELKNLLFPDKVILLSRFAKVMAGSSMSYSSLSESERFEVLKDLRYINAPFDLFYSWCSDSAVESVEIEKWFELWKGLKGLERERSLGLFEIAKKRQVIDYSGMGRSKYDAQKYFDDNLYNTAPGPVKIVANYIIAKSIRKHKGTALAAAISLLSAFYHRRIAAYHSSCEKLTFTNFYNALIANSGFGKGAVTGTIKDLSLDLLGEKRVPLVNAPASGGGFYTSLKQYQGDMFFILDEFAGQLLNKIAGNNLPTFLSTLLADLTNAYSVSDSAHRFDTMNQDDSKRIKYLVERPHISIFGSATTRDFINCYKTALGHNGFLARFLVIIPDPKTVISNYRPSEFFKNNRSEVVDLLTRILEIPAVNKKEENPKVIPYESYEAEEYYLYMEEMYRQKACAMVEEEPNDYNEAYTAVYGRIAEKALKLALIAHEDGVISKKSLEWAFDVAECSAANIFNHLFGYSNMPHSEFQKETEALYKFILSKNHEYDRPISLSEITKGYRRLDSKTIHKYLAELEKQGRLRIDQSEGKSGHIKTEVVAI